MPADRLMPIFSLSSVTGDGIDQLRHFISKLGNRDKICKNIGKPEDKLDFNIN